nr:DinB family protein [Paenibacillus hamazuiensis]
MLNQVQIVRAITLKTLRETDPAIFDTMPPGYSNTIRCNAGHILIVQDTVSAHFAGLEPRLPPEYLQWFGNGSRPSLWEGTPPGTERLLAELEEQTGHIIRQLGPRLNERAVKPFSRLGYKMETIGELLNYSLYHEGVHMGMINALSKAAVSLKA